MQARLNSEWDVRHGGREERPEGNRSLGPFDRSVRAVKVREPEADHVSGETKKKGPDHHARSHEGRNGKTGDR